MEPLRRRGGARERRGDGTRRAALLLLLACAAPRATAQEETPAETREIELGSDVDAALEAAQRDRLPVIVVFTATWCRPCRTFEGRTLRAPEVRELASSFHWVEVDIDDDVGLTREFEVEATPTTVALSPDGIRVGSAEGALEPARFVEFLEAVRAVEDGVAGAPYAAELESEHPTRLTWSTHGYRARAMCFSQVGYGPLGIPSQAFGQVFRLSLRPTTPSTLAGGQLELFWTETFANVFGYEENDFRLDYLTLNSTLGLGYGLSDTLRVDLSVGNLLRTKSYLDGITNAFHDAFGLGDSGRDDFPENDNVIDLEPFDGLEIEDTSSGSEATHVALSLQHNVTCGTETWPALAYAVSARWDGPGDAELEGDSPFSVGLSGSAARRVGEEFYGYLGLAYNWYGPDESRGLPLEDEQWGALAALEWSYRDSRALVLQYLVSEGVAVERDPFDETTHEVHLGWKGEIRPGTVLEIGLIENVINVDNSPDFGLHFGLRHRW